TVREPELRGAWVRRNMLDVLSAGYDALVLEDLLGRVAVANGALVEAALDLVVWQALADLKGIKKLRVPALPIPDCDCRHTEGGSKVGIGRPELAHLRRDLGERGDVFGRASAHRLVLGRLLTLALPPAAKDLAADQGVYFRCFRHGTSLCYRRVDPDRF